jgi:acyl carrier protein
VTQSEGMDLAIAEQLSRYVCEEVLGDGTAVGFEQNLLGEGLVDSLGMLRLVGFIEASYPIKTSPADFTIENFRSISSIARYVSRLLNEAGA